MKKREKIDIESLPVRVLVINLYLTQFISVGLAFILYLILHKMNPIEAIVSILPGKLIQPVLVGFLFSLVVIVVDIILSKKLPEKWLDDGGINEKLFRHLPIWHIAIITVMVGFVEEFLFRGAVQSYLGVFLTSLIFTLIHFRYLKKWVLISMTFLISLGLGYLVILTGQWISAFVAHSMIDFVLGILIRKNWL
ncbi:CPBP family intramembrane glutamic endopeptidase [Tepidibacillus sp. HK-1]|uniref:CPBP family intramembrane glutamic endopeptidase n=1 Tax=Tepidibacillus sp. HK-1 TaxID=1883407 RepID=UPI000853C8A4|nr:type II CAAX endopeptidase family protein [Tepidibacillus sp. HK-1]GBF11585.1 CAAX amino terminal protease self- immunity [Tepidibacillus sp. HK-1]